jgi:hypothetical protein
MPASRGSRVGAPAACVISAHGPSGGPECTRDRRCGPWVDDLRPSAPVIVGGIDTARSGDSTRGARACQMRARRIRSRAMLGRHVGFALAGERLPAVSGARAGSRGSGARRRVGDGQRGVGDLRADERRTRAAERSSTPDDSARPRKSTAPSKAPASCLAGAVASARAARRRGSSVRAVARCRKAAAAGKPPRTCARSVARSSSCATGSSGPAVACARWQNPRPASRSGSGSVTLVRAAWTARRSGGDAGSVRPEPAALGLTTSYAGSRRAGARGTWRCGHILVAIRRLLRVPASASSDLARPDASARGRHQDWARAHRVRTRAAYVAAAVSASGIGRQQPETVTREPRRVVVRYVGKGPHIPKPLRCGGRLYPWRGMTTWATWRVRAQPARVVDVTEPGRAARRRART